MTFTWEHVSPRSTGRTSAMLDELYVRALAAPTRRAFVSADEEMARLIRDRVGSLADVHHQRDAPRGCVLEYSADNVPAFRPKPRPIVELDGMEVSRG